jgi:glutathione S-transferase
MEPSTALHPKDPLEKAMGRLLVEKAGKMVRPFYGIMMAKGETTKEVKEKRKEIFNEMKKTLEYMDKELKKKGSKFFSGNCVGMTDLMVWPWIERLPVHNIMFPGEGMEFPSQLTSLQAWIKNMWEVPAIKAYGLDGAAHAKFYAQYFSEHCDFDMLLTNGA